MEYFLIENGKVKELTKEEFDNLNGTNVNEIIKDMSPDELDAFKKERDEKFIKPFFAVFFIQSTEINKHPFIELRLCSQLF